MQVLQKVNELPFELLLSPILGTEGLEEPIYSEHF